MRVPVYDIQNCGPRHRFVANGKLVHNSDKINLQNLPSRGQNAGELKKAIKAPDGYVLIDSDSSQIEARVLAWLAEQDDLVEDFREKKDAYKKMSTRIYNVDLDDVTKAQRAVGKETVLGAGFGMGGPRFQIALKNRGIVVPVEEAGRIIRIYRDTNPMIVDLWKEAHAAIRGMVRGNSTRIGRNGLIEADGYETAFRLPNGLLIRYNDLREDPAEKGPEYTYKTREGRTRIFGPKAVENIVQALARIIVGEQMVAIAKRYRVVLTVHDSVVACVRAEEAEEAKAYIETCMRTPPSWAPDLPVNCEAGIGPNYGETE